MLDFLDAYTLWRRQPFPQGGRGDVLPGTKGDLVLADHYVTSVIAFVERGVYRPASADVLGLLRDIKLRIDDAMDGLPPEQQQIAREQHAYAALIELVYEQFLALAPDRDQ